MRHRHIVFITLLGLFSCADHAPSQDGLVRIGWPGSPDSRNPGTAVLSQAYTLFALIYDTLYTLKLDGSYAPDLVIDHQPSKDGRVHTFRIRRDAFFHDGQPLTAQDVAFSLNFYHAHIDFPLLHAYTREFKEATAPDEDTVVLELRTPVPNMESLLAFLFILPQHVWQPHAEGEAALQFDNADMVGSGPFRLVEYQQSTFVHLAPHPTQVPGPGHIEGVIFQTFSNQDALVQAIRTGQVDAITEMPFTAFENLKTQPDVRVFSGTPYQPEITDIIINQLAPQDAPPGSVASGHPALRDVRVRRALALATDKQHLLDIVLLGHGTPGLTLIPDGLGIWFNSDLSDTPFDPALARDLLDQAGYRDLDADGIRDTPDGEPLTFRVNWPTDSTISPRMARMLANMWAEVGIGTRLQAVDPDALTALCCPEFDYDIMLWGWTTASDPAFLLDIMTSFGIPTGTNESGYADATYDLLFQQQATELDAEHRKQIVWEMQRRVHDAVAYIIPFYPKVLQATRTDRFTGWVTDTPRLGIETLESLSALAPVP
jgi:peptide/nickel transport system substrate-binding protein